MFGQSNNTGSIDLRMDVSVLEEKSFLKMLRLTFSSKLNWGSYIGASLFLKCIQENWSLIHSMKFLSTEITLYILLQHLGWCPSCYLELLDKPQKRICRTVIASFAAFLEPFGS